MNIDFDVATLAVGLATMSIAAFTTLGRLLIEKFERSIESSNAIVIHKQIELGDKQDDTIAWLEKLNGKVTRHDKQISNLRLRMAYSEGQRDKPLDDKEDR